MNTKMAWRLVPALVLFLGGQASAGTITAFNTGVDASGNPLAGGSLDPHWSIIAGPGITSPVPALVVSDQSGQGFYAQSLNSRWIWEDASGAAAFNSPYTFLLTFDLTGFNPTTAMLSGAWGADNDGSILLNGATPIGTGTFALDDDLFGNFTAFHSFTITGGFVSGINDLEFQTTDLGVVGALNVNSLVLTASPSAVPEPSSLMMLAIGTFAVAATCLRRRGARRSGGGG